MRDLFYDEQIRRDKELNAKIKTVPLEAPFRISFT
ncbi:Uncharacterised protein [Yersinia enterocolitica]|nr:Uncharacterised protein [Yersinia enterocolitica]CQH28587.1 Uncharacterised protein [Yersinia enterocolitica]